MHWTVLYLHVFVFARQWLPKACYFSIVPIERRVEFYVYVVASEIIIVPVTIITTADTFGLKPTFLDNKNSHATFMMEILYSQSTMGLHNHNFFIHWSLHDFEE